MISRSAERKKKRKRIFISTAMERDFFAQSIHKTKKMLSAANGQTQHSKLFEEICRRCDVEKKEKGKRRKREKTLMRKKVNAFLFILLFHLIAHFNLAPIFAFLPRSEEASWTRPLLSIQRERKNLTCLQKLSEKYRLFLCLLPLLSHSHTHTQASKTTSEHRRS